MILYFIASPLRRALHVDIEYGLCLPAFPIPDHPQPPVLLLIHHLNLRAKPHVLHVEHLTQVATQAGHVHQVNLVLDNVHLRVLGGRLELEVPQVQPPHVLRPGLVLHVLREQALLADHGLLLGGVNRAHKPTATA